MPELPEVETVRRTLAPAVGAKILGVWDSGKGLHMRRRPPRKLLHLTPGGRAAFARWLVAPVAHGRDFRLEFLAKLYFASQDHPASAGTLIATQQVACRDWLADLRARADALRDARDYDWLVLQFRIGQIEAILGWLEVCAATAIPASA